jgi:hypothetical protein
LNNISHFDAINYFGEQARPEEFVKMNKNGFCDYRSPDPHDKDKNFDESFWRLLEAERVYKARTGETPSAELRVLDQTISESRSRVAMQDDLPAASLR